MPYMEKSYPATDGKSLSRRAARSGVVLSLARASLPGQMVLRLRRTADSLGELCLDQNAPAPDRIAAARAMVSVQDQLIDLLGIPRRPAAAGGKRPSAPTLDISPASPLPPPDIPD